MHILLTYAIPSSAFSPVTYNTDGTITQNTANPQLSTPSPYRYVQGEILVRFRKSVPTSSMAAVHAKAGTTVKKHFRNIHGLQLVKLPPEMSVPSALKKFSKEPTVLYTEPNYIVNALLTPNDSSFPQLWGLANTGQTGGIADADIDATDAWNLTTGSPNTVIAVIDSGVDYTHPDLAQNIFTNPADCNNNGIDDDGNGYIDDCHGINTLANNSDPMDDNGHGTHVSGTIGATGNNLTGVVGVNWTTRILACKFMDADGEGDTAGAIACLDYIADMKDHGVDIAASNNSWGGGPYSQALSDAIDAQRERGILFVAAAGNNGADNEILQDYPCSYEIPNIICVGSTDANDNQSSFSNYGKRIVHISAPGEDILSTVPFGGYQSLSGTSMATPHVSGVVGLIHTRYPALDWRVIKNRLLAGGDKKTSLSQTITGRRLNAYGALTCSNSAASGRLRPLGSSLSAGPGTKIELAALNINCEKPNGNVAVTVSPTGTTVTLTDNGLGDDQVAGDGIYTATWAPPSGGTFTLAFPGGDNVTVNVDGDLQPGFPVKAWHMGGTYHGGQAIHTLIADTDGTNSGLDIIATSLSLGPLNAWDSNGKMKSGWPIYAPGAAYPAAGQLSTTSTGDDICYGTFDSDSYLFANDGTGMTLPGWPHQSTNYIATPPSLTDVNGDGLDEIFVEEEDWKIHAYKANGTPLGGWPTTQLLGGQERHTPAIADIDGDNQPEIITASGWLSDVGVRLFAYHTDGSSVTGFPVSFNGYTDTYPAIGDVDGDGKKEIVVVDKYLSLGTWFTRVLIYSANGLLKHATLLSGSVPYGTAPALADLNGDGVPEIIIQTDSALNVLRGDTTSLPGWPVTWGSGYSIGNSSPVIGDVDGDGFPDIVITTQVAGSAETGVVRVYNRNGISHPHFPKTLPIGNSAVPAIADIDGDGRNEIIITGNYWNGVPGYYNKIWVYDLGGPKHGPVLWGQFMDTAKHTGRYTGFKKDQTITFSPLPAKTYGNPQLTLGATASSGLPVTYWSSNTTVATIEGNSLTIKGAGSSTITATQQGDDNYNPAAHVSQLLNVNKANVALSITSHSPNPSIMLQPVTVGYSATSPAGTPAGDITISDGISSCTNTVASGSCLLSVSTAGERILTAQYLGNDNFSEAVSPGVPQTVSSGYPLIVDINGTGGGAVTTDTGAMQWALNIGTATYGYSIPVTLTAAEDAVSSFSGWSGCDSLTNRTCQVTMISPKTLTASFTLNGPLLPAAIARSTFQYYPAIQPAYENASNYDIIETQSHVFYEALTLNRDISIKLKGGYDSTYSTQAGRSTISGLTISSGAITVENLIIH